MIKEVKFAAKRRKGTGLLPPNPKQWDNEHNGLDLREEIEADLVDALDVEGAFNLLENVYLTTPRDFALPEKYLQHLQGNGKAWWSGMALQLHDMTFVVFNDSHSRNRIRATLMEEFFHLWLGHPPSIVRLYDAKGKLRTHDRKIENEAYASGAAALLPYKPLKALVESGVPVGEIAGQFSVSNDLVVFRSKVTKLFRRLNVRKRGQLTP